MAVAQVRERAEAPAAEPGPRFADLLAKFDAAISDDLNTPLALTVLDDVVAMKKVDPAEKLAAIAAIDAVLGLDLMTVDRAALRLRPASATIDEARIAEVLAERRTARADKDFARSDALRDDLAAQGVEVMDGDPLGWDWRPI